jgi:hypothetical protein
MRRVFFKDSMMETIRRHTGALVLVTGLWIGIAAGRFASPDYVPAERLIENATAYTQEEPNDPAGYYTLARIHYLAFVNKAFLVGTFNGDDATSVIPYWWWEDYLAGARRAEAVAIALGEFGYKSTDDVPSEQSQAFWDRVQQIIDDLTSGGWQPKPPTELQLIEHAAAAQWNFYKAIALDPGNGLYRLGLASLGEQYIEYFDQISPTVMPTTIRTIALDAIKSTYLAAYDLAIDEDLTQESLPIGGLAQIISYEAGSAFVRLWEAEPEIPADVQDKIAAIKAELARFESLPPGAVTPIIFSLENTASLADLLALDHTVRFDLDGDGAVEQRPWVKPTTGFLAWDADNDGEITSGRELFGSVTWWLFFPNGYRALDVLDDNRDGFLTGMELNRLCVWFDRNSNGRSDTAEVVSLETLGIAAVATRPTGRDRKSPMHSAGIGLNDGRTVATYDWIAPGISEDNQSPSGSIGRVP